MGQVLSEKAFKGMEMEGFTAKWYASQTRKSLDDFQILARRVAREYPAGGRVLEVAPGPGYFSIELAKLGKYQVTGLDISRSFVDIARKNAEEAQVEVDFRHGNASSMPFEDNTFDFLLCRAAFKNFSDPLPALQEMYRVLRKGGRALIIDLRRDASIESINKFVSGMNLNVPNALTTRLIFRFVLLKRAYTQAEIEQLLDQTKFGRVEIHQDLIGMQVDLQK